MLLFLESTACSNRVVNVSQLQVAPVKIRVIAQFKKRKKTNRNIGQKSKEVGEYNDIYKWKSYALEQTL